MQWLAVVRCIVIDSKNLEFLAYKYCQFEPIFVLSDFMGIDFQTQFCIFLPKPSNRQSRQNRYIQFFSYLYILWKSNGFQQKVTFVLDGRTDFQSFIIFKLGATFK